MPRRSWEHSGKSIKEGCLSGASLPRQPGRLSHAGCAAADCVN